MQRSAGGRLLAGTEGHQLGLQQLAGTEVHPARARGKIGKVKVYRAITVAEYLDLGGHDLGGGRGGGLNSSPLLSFLVEKVRGSSWRERAWQGAWWTELTWKRGRGRHDWLPCMGGGLQGVEVSCWFPRGRRGVAKGLGGGVLGAGGDIIGGRVRADRYLVCKVG